MLREVWRDYVEGWYVWEGEIVTATVIKYNGLPLEYPQYKGGAYTLPCGKVAFFKTQAEAQAKADELDRQYP